MLVSGWQIIQPRKSFFSEFGISSLTRLDVIEMKKLFSLKSSRGGQNCTQTSPDANGGRSYTEIPLANGVSDIVVPSPQSSRYVVPVYARKVTGNSHTDPNGPVLRRSRSSSSTAAARCQRNKNGDSNELSKRSLSPCRIDVITNHPLESPPDYQCPTSDQNERSDLGLIKMDCCEVMNVDRDCSFSSHSSSPRSAFSAASVISPLESSNRNHVSSRLEPPNLNRDSSQLVPDRKHVSSQFETATKDAELEAANGCLESSRLEPSDEKNHGSIKVLDLYIDGEQQKEIRSKYNYESHQRNANIRNNSSLYGKGISSKLFPSTKIGSFSRAPSADCLRYDNRQRSPRKVARDVVQRLSRSQEFAVGALADKLVDRRSPSPVMGGSRRPSPSKSFVVNRGREPVYALGSQKQNPIPNQDKMTLLLERKEEIDSQLHMKLKETDRKALLLSKELEQEFISQYYGCTVSTLCQKMRNLTKERRDLVVEVSTQLQCRISERMSAKDALSMVKSDLNAKLVRLEKEKNQVQADLQKELDRRSNDLDSKLKEYQSEESRLRDRVRELAETNISLQRELSTFYCKEKDFESKIRQMEAQLSDTTSKLENVKSDDLGARDKLKAAEEMLARIQRNFNEKGKENKELVKVVARLQRANGEQERTIDGLRQGLNLVPESQQPVGHQDFERYTNRLQMEHLRLTGTEQALRREVETCRHENESLRRENISLLERLRDTNKLSAERSSMNLEQELSSRINILQDSGLSILKESTEMCGKLLEYVKNRTGAVHGGMAETESSDWFMDRYSIMEWEMKVQGHRHGLDQLKRNLQKTASRLKQKSERDASSGTEIVSEVDIKSELKAEILMTSLLKEKLYFQEQEMEQLQADLAATLRNQDALKSEIQSAIDSISCANHQMKDVELQAVKKQNTINQLENDLQARNEELTATRGILTKVSKERDLIWEEVKQYNEKNMLLSYEINALKKKIEGLEEDTLLKEGQISILKDSLNSSKYVNILYDNESETVDDVFKYLNS